MGQSKFLLFGAVTNDDMNRREGDVTVTVTANGSPVTTTVTSNSGKFKVALDYGKRYKIEFNKGGLAARHLYVDLVGVNEEDLPAGDLMQEMEMTLYAEVPGVDMSFFAQEPTTTFSVNMKKMMVDMDGKQISSMKSKIDDMLEKKEELGDQTEAINKQYDESMAAGDKSMALKEYKEALSHYQNAEKLKPTEALPKTKIEEAKAKIKEEEEAKKLAEQEAKYNEAIAAADKAFIEKDWNKALSGYEEALGYKPNDKHATERVVAIDEILSEQKRKELEEKQKNEEYYNLIQAADNLRDQKNYEKAIQTYQQALEKKEEQYPKDQIQNIEQIMADADAAEKLEKEYTAAMTAAKALFDQKNYEEAKSKYVEASGLKPDEQEPKDKITEIEGILQNLADQMAKDKAYEEALAEANTFFDAKEWQKSIDAYNKALGIKPDEQTPKDKIVLAQAEIEKLKNQEQLEKEFAEKIAEADQLFAEGKLTEAKPVYLSASTIKPEEGYPKSQVELIDSKLAEQNAAAEQQKQYDELIAAAGQLFQQQKYQEAKSKYQEAQTIKPSESLPGEKIEEINALLGELAAAEELESNYTSAMEAAKNAFSTGDLVTAKAKYEEASGLKPNEQEPKDKIAEINQLLEQQAANAEQEAQYNQLIAEADGLLNAGKLEEAKAKYQDALGVKDEAYPKGQITQIDEQLAERLKKEQQEQLYQQKIAQADQLRDAEKYAEAIAVYQEAQEIDALNEYPKEQIKKLNDKLAAKQSEAEKEQQFTELVAAANSLYGSGDLKGAITKFEEALSYKEDADVRQRITAISEELAAKEAELSKEQNYSETIARAQGQEASGNLSGAIAEYEKATQIKPEEELPRQKISELKDRLAKQSADQELNNQIAQLVSEGDTKLGAGNYDGAKEKYHEALSLREDDAIRRKLEDVEARMKAETQEQEERNYQKIIDKADQLKNAEDFENAIGYYERALTIKPADAYPTQKIAEIREIIEQRKKQEAQNAEVTAEYDAVMKSGDAKLAAGDLSGALEQFVKAKNLKPNESLPGQKIEQVNNLMASKMNAEKAQQEYKKYMSEGNKLADARNYQEAIKTFEKALAVKAGDPDAQKRIQEVKALIESEKNQADNQKYAEWIGQGNRAFSEENYDVAKNAYNEALKVKPNDKAALDKIEEINKILESIAEQKLKEAETEQAYRKVISKADTRFVKEDWKSAQEFYQEALTIRPLDKYAKSQLNLVIEKQKEESEKEAEKQYLKILAKADDFFDSENWEKAKGMYERALTFRANDQYPKDKLVEIEAILANGGKMPVKLENLGKKENISILEGEALFVKAEENRRYKRNLKVKKTEEEIQDKSVVVSESEEEERLKAREVVAEIEKEKSAFEADRSEEQQVIAEEVDQLNTSLKAKEAEDNLFAYAERLRREAYARQVVIEKAQHEEGKIVIPNENEEIIKGKTYEIEQKLRNDAMDEQVVHQETRSLVVDVEEKYSGFQEEDKMIVDANEMALKGLKFDLDTKTDEELLTEYDRVQRMIQEMEEISKNKNSAEEDLLLIGKDIDDKISRVNKEISDNVREKALSDYEVIKTIEGKIIAVNEEVSADNEGRDLDRQENVETVKGLFKHQDDVAAERTDEKKTEILDTRKEVGKVEEKYEVAVSDRAEEREEIVDAVEGLNKEQGDHFSKQSDDKTKDIYLTKKTVSNIEEGVRKEKEKESEKQTDNNEVITSTKQDLEDQAGKDSEDKKKRTLEMRRMLESLETKGIRFSESVANTLGEEFPEGVTEQNFTIEDEDGLLVEMKTRRIVVKDGRGDVYVRSSNKYGTTYTKNGEPIAEYVWQRDTQDAKLVRHK